MIIESLVKERTDCRACGAPLKALFSLGEQEVVNLGDKPPMKAPLTVVKCERCNLVQLDRTISRDYLFGTYYYRSKATATMREHLKEVVKEAMKRAGLKAGDVILDIGSNDGFTLEQYIDSPVRVGFEPSSIYKESSWTHSGATNDFFSAEGFGEAAQKFTQKKQAKAITALGMFYDLDDPNAFLQDVKKVLAPDGLFVLQVNYLPDTLKNNAVGDFVHEHLCYYSLKTLNGLLRKNGFYIEGYRFSPINGGSVIVFVRHGAGDRIQIFNDDAMDERFFERVAIAAVKVKAFTLDKTVDIGGASTRGATFLQFGNIRGRFVVERDSSKVGKTYLGMPIVSEEASFADPPDVKLLVATWFKDETVKREKAFLDGGGTLVVPLPEPKLITKDGERPL